MEDDATVRKIVAAAHWVLQCVSQIGTAGDMPSLLKGFQVFSRAILLMRSLVEERIPDLRSPKQQEQVRGSMHTLTKCVPMLHTAMYTTIKHPASEQAQAAKTYVLQQVNSTVNDIVVTLKSNCHWSLSGPNGYYTDRRNGLLRLLGVSDCSAIKVSDFDVLVRDLVFHCMMVANTSRSETQPEVAENCQHALELWSEISHQLKVRDDTLQCKQHLESLCASLIQRIHKLDEALVTATLCQVLDVFVSAGTPMEQLVNTISHIFEVEPEGREFDQDSFEPLLRVFSSHADRMVQVTGFMAALATDAKSLEQVENSKTSLMRLRDGVAPLLQELRGDSVQCSEALQKLLDLHQRWVDDTNQLMSAFSDIMDIKAFTTLAVQGMEDSLHGCETAHKCQDPQLFSEHAGLLMGHMNQVILAVRRHVDKSDDPIYRNGLLVLVRQAEAAIAEVAGCVTDACASRSQGESTYGTFSDQLTLAIKNFEVLREGLDGLQHPDLLSPLREEARNPMNLLPVLPTMEPVPVLPSVLDPREDDTEDHFSDQDSESIVSTAKPNIEFLMKAVDHNLSIPTVQQFQQIQHFKDTELGKSYLIFETKPPTAPEKLPNETVDLIPLLNDVVSMTEDRDVTALNVACSSVLELSNCYAQAAKEAVTIIDKDNSQEVECLRSELVSLTPLLVQTAQETAMSSGMTMESIYKHSTQFSDLIRNTRNVLLPVAGTWYRAISAMFQCGRPGTRESLSQELTEVMCLCADVVQVVISLEYTARGEGHESISVLQNKLTKAQTNTKQITDLASKPPVVFDVEGPCLLWGLSMQVLLNSLDKIIGTAASANTGQLTKHQMTPKKWLTTISENSLRIQEAARLSSLNCRDHYKVKTLSELQSEVKALTDAYLQAEEDLGTASDSGILLFAKSELLQRQLQANMKRLSGLLSKVNKDYVIAIENAITLAYSATAKNQTNTKAQEAQKHFENAADFLLENVKAATESVKDCFNYIRDPRERIQLRFINDHLSFQMSDIVNRIRLMVEAQAYCESLSLEIQTQCWSAKAHYLVEELFKVDGILERIKEQVKLGLQGKKVPSEVPVTWTDTPSAQAEVAPPTNTVTGTKQRSEPRSTQTVHPTINIPTSPKQEPRMVKQDGCCM